MNIWLSDSCTSVCFKAIWGEIAWVSLIYLWNGTVPWHDDALSVTSFLMDLWDGKHRNLSQVWELFFYLIKLVSRRFLCAIDPSNGSAAPCCAKVHNKYLLCSLYVKICLKANCCSVHTTGGVLSLRKKKKTCMSFCFLPPLNSLVSPSP